MTDLTNGEIPKRIIKNGVSISIFERFTDSITGEDLYKFKDISYPEGMQGDSEGNTIPKNGCANDIETLENWFNWFRNYDNRYLYPKFEPEGRRDLYAFNLLDKILGPTKSGIIDAAEHDVIYLSVTLEDLVEAGSVCSDDVRKLYGCGVHIGEYGLEMFV